MAKETGEIPKALENRPVVRPWQLDFMNAFETLNGSRRWTQAGPVNIPLSEISAYFDVCGIHDLDDKNEYLQIIQFMDNAYLKQVMNK